MAIKRKYKRFGRGQKVCGRCSIARKRIWSSKKICETGTRLTKKALKEGLKYNRGVSRTKNDRIRNALNSNLANTGLNYGSTFAADRYY